VNGTVKDFNEREREVDKIDSSPLLVTDAAAPLNSKVAEAELTAARSTARHFIPVIVVDLWLIIASVGVVATNTSKISCVCVRVLNHQLIVRFANIVVSSHAMHVRVLEPSTNENCSRFAHYNPVQNRVAMRVPFRWRQQMCMFFILSAGPVPINYPRY
jgi:hypothetical protein